jgi:type IV pilus assembly protein PilE
MNTLLLKKQVKAFTLAELLVVLCIIGILVLISLPKLMPLISKAKSTEAQLQLGYLHTLEKSHFYLHSRYTDDLEEIGFEHEKLVSEGDRQII